MPTIRKILFPLDFSEPCKGAARYVEALAGRFQAEVTLLYVVDIGPSTRWGGAELYGAPVVDIAGRTAGWAREEMGKFLADEWKHLDVKHEVLEGDAGTKVVDLAKNSGSDLIMMPTHGLSRFRRYILGSVTAKVLHDAECPVWTAVHMESAPPLEAIHFPKVMCAVDMGAQSENALRWAADFAAENSAELIATYVVPASEGRPAKYFEQPFVREIASRVQGDLTELLDTLGIKARIVIEAGDPSKVVSQIAQNEQISQLVIGRGSSAQGLGRLRTHAYAIIRSAPCPVVSV